MPVTARLEADLAFCNRTNVIFIPSWPARRPRSDDATLNTCTGQRRFKHYYCPMSLVPLPVTTKSVKSLQVTMTSFVVAKFSIQWHFFPTQPCFNTGLCRNFLSWLKKFIRDCKALPLRFYYYCVYLLHMMIVSIAIYCWMDSDFKLKKAWEVEFAALSNECFSSKLSKQTWR